MSGQKFTGIAGLPLSRRAVRVLKDRGIFAHSLVSIEHQHLAQFGTILLAVSPAGRIVCGMCKVVGSSSPAAKAADLTTGYWRWCHNVARKSWRC